LIFFLNQKVNPSLFNEFATATLRYGHSAVTNIFNRYNSDNSIIEGASLNLSSMVFKADQAYKYIKKLSSNCIMHKNLIYNFLKRKHEGNRVNIRGSLK